jgi:RNA polymerase-binding protein DksA
VAKKSSPKKKARKKGSNSKTESARQKSAKSSGSAKTRKKSKKAASPKAGKSAKKSVKKSAKKSAKKATKARKSSARRKSAKVRTSLTKSQLKDFREMLLEKRRELVGDMNGIEADALGKDRQDDRPEAFNMPTHPADVGTDNYEQEFTLGLLESERILLQEIDDALDRIERKTFGICMGTGEPIGLPRLRARPWSKYCIEYQRQLEKGLVKPVEDEDDEHAYGGIDDDVDLEEEEDDAVEADDTEPEQDIDEDEDF